MKFEFLIATRYLRAKRKQAVISLITFIAILGVGAGVAALVVAMAVSEGQRQDIEGRLLGAQAHVTIRASQGITDYEALAKQIEQVEGVVGAAPHAEGDMAVRSAGLTIVNVKGIIPEMEKRVSPLSQNIDKGQLTDLTGNTIVIGKGLAEKLKVGLGDDVTIISSTTSGGLAPGSQFNRITFTVVAIYSIGLFEYDLHLVYVPFKAATILNGSGDVATNIGVKVRDLDRSKEVGQAILDKIGPGYDFEDWRDANESIFHALNLEQLGMAIAISLIVFVAALNIVATLTMMVLEKTRDIAALMAMGAKLSQIRRIFMLQGMIIGVVGTAIGLVLGHAISYFADKYELIYLDPAVYSISYLPLRAVLSDSVFIAVSAVLISFLATLYPSAAAARLQPVEALRYE